MADEYVYTRSVPSVLDNGRPVAFGDVVPSDVFDAQQHSELVLDDSFVAAPSDSSDQTADAAPDATPSVKSTTKASKTS